AAGTGPVRVINPSTPWAAYQPTLANGVLYFVADDGVHGRELWQTDGTAAGTMLVQDIAPGPLSSDPIALTLGSGTLFFSASDGVHGRELWKAGGTVSVQASPVTATAGQAFSGVVATFTDPTGPAAPTAYTATITWGDGHTSTGTVTARGHGVFA